AARHVVYGEKIVEHGPVPLSAKRLGNAAEGSLVTVAFGDVTGALVAYSAGKPIGFEVCGEAGSCQYALAELQPDRVELFSTVSHPTRVRYAWADSPVVNLFDEAGLPVGPFEIPIE
ncbi:MAG: 9-O-acetylesterase, partial [Caulobacter sp.]|nr:9-O-acetylesterase [Caulobacter sp.]